MHSVRCATALPLLWLALLPFGVAAEFHDGLQPLHERAVQALRDQQWAAAYGRFAQLADAGHVPSAELALLMHQQGSRLFGSDWSASPDQKRRWNALVVRSARQGVEGDDLARAE